MAIICEISASTQVNALRQVLAMSDALDTAIERWWYHA